MLKASHQKFVLKYLETNDATESYLWSYPKSSKSTAKANGHKLLKRDDVKEYLAEKQQELEDSAILNLNDIKEQLTEIALHNRSSTPSRLRALHQLTQMLGGYKHHVTTENRTTIDYSHLTDEELDELLEEEYINDA